MRYLVSVTKKQEEKFKQLLHDQDIRIVDKYEPVVALTEKVEKMGAALKEFKATGATWDIFNYYMRGKGIAQADIDGVMGVAIEFFKKVGIM